MFWNVPQIITHHGKYRFINKVIQGHMFRCTNYNSISNRAVPLVDSLVMSMGQQGSYIINYLIRLITNVGRVNSDGSVTLSTSINPLTTMNSVESLYSILSINFVTNASELLENSKEMFSRYYNMHIDLLYVEG